MDEIGVGFRLDHLLSTANAILKQDHIGDGEPAIVSQPWAYRFLQRHPELHKMRQKPIELVRKLIQAKNAVQVKSQLAKNTVAERERSARRCRPHSQLKKGGVLYASQAREMVKQREEEGGSQLQRALRREAQLRVDLERPAESAKRDHLEWLTLLAGDDERL